MRPTTAQRWLITTAIALATSGGARGESCHESAQCTAPWSACWTLGSCGDGHCLYEPRICGAGQACDKEKGACTATPFLLTAAQLGKLVRLTLTNQGALPVKVTIDPQRAVIDDLSCETQPNEGSVRPLSTVNTEPPARTLKPGQRATVDVDLRWIAHPSDEPPLLVRYDLKPGAICSARFLYRLDDGALIGAPAIKLTR